MMRFVLVLVVLLLAVMVRAEEETPEAVVNCLVTAETPEAVVNCLVAAKETPEVEEETPEAAEETPEAAEETPEAAEEMPEAVVYCLVAAEETPEVGEETPEAAEETPAAAEETPEEKGLRIAIAAEKQDEGFHSYTAVGQMVLCDKQGRESLRDFHFKMLEVPDDGNKSLITFDRPSDIRDTALLTITHKVGDDDQWMYLPALKRVKRIGSSNRSGAFLASEFAYEDFLVPPVERYSYKWLRDEPCPGTTDLACHAIERYSTDDSSGYSRQVTWLDQSQYRIFKIDYYDRKNSHLKTLIISDYRQYEGRYWRASTLSVSNHQTGKSTLLTWSDYEFGVDLRDSQFTKRALERGD